jgi:predicted nucleic acid-binding Zn ribbon protein
MDTFLVVVLFFNVLWCIWCYKIAANNGRDKNFAILMGLLLGLLAVIVYAIIGKTDKKKKEETAEVVVAMQASKDKKKCPFCSEMIMVDAKKCRYCGEFLDKK